MSDERQPTNEQLRGGLGEIGAQVVSGLTVAGVTVVVKQAVEKIKPPKKK
jgi:hypothetical protein